MDDNISVRELINKIIVFRKERGWQKNTAKDLSVSIVLEAAELLEHFQWGHFERKKIQQDKDGNLGLIDWPEINPRGVKDKAFLVFKKHGKPL